MNLIINLFSIIGSLALFLFGMKTMSEGLEKFAGNRLRSILGAMTKNRVLGVFTGLGITALIQSSSATTVMVVSFVNAGLMSLRQAIGVIMGANIGTTATAWIISSIGFKVSISAFSIPLLAIGLPLIFSNKSKRKSMGEFIYGFSFLFMGLALLQDAANRMELGTIIANMLANLPFADGSFGTIILLVIVGAVATIVFQSSSATMAITLMLFGMNIPGFGFEQAAALTLGENVGTTITAFIASQIANIQARRAALAHMFFNVFGVVAVLSVFPWFCAAVEWLVLNFMHSSNALFLLPSFHTTFNVLNTLIQIWFVPQIESIVCKVLPEKQSDEPEKLTFISGGILSTAELSLLEARKEIALFGERCLRQFGIVAELHEVDKDEKFEEIFKRVEKYEGITDNMEIEIAHYLQKVSEGRLSDDAKRQVQRMLREVDDLESIGDCNFNLARVLSRKRSLCKEHFTAEQLGNIKQMEQLVDEALRLMTEALSAGEGEGHDIGGSYRIEDDINTLYAYLRDENTQKVSQGDYDYRLGAFYMDFINGLERVANYILNVVQSKARQKRE